MENLLSNWFDNSVLMEEFIVLIKVFFISLSPLEMKTGIPLAIVNYNIDPVIAYFVCCSANILGFPILYTFLNTIHKPLLKNNSYKRMSINFARRSKAKTANLIKKYGMSGLFVFVLIPLPLTGVYTGSVVAWLLNAKKKQAFIAISCGLFVSGLLVTFFTVMAQRGALYTFNLP